MRTKDYAHFVHLLSFIWRISLIIQTVHITITIQSNNPVNPIALMLKPSAINGKKLNIAPAYHATMNPTVIAITSLRKLGFTFLLPPKLI